MPEAKYSLADMLYLMERLRNPKTGCPWDCKQTFASIAPYTLEEVYEVIDTIERGDYRHLKEELGDLLFQVVFYSQLGRELGYFQFSDVVSTLVEKLVSRHPHVFPDGTLASERDAQSNPDETAIKKNWEKLKKTERSHKGRHNLLDDIPANLPALSRAQKVQKRAAGVGFDWPDAQGVLAKICEEAQEVTAAAGAADPQQIDEEMGDLLFACVNLCRHLGVESEGALRRATRKFEYRFNYIEECAAKDGKRLDAMELEEMDALWETAKSHNSR